MPAERIASLLASATEILYALGAGDRVIGVSHECDYPPEAAEKPRLSRTRVDHRASSEAIDRQVRALVEAGGPLYEIDLDRLRTLRPDCIVTQSQCDVCAVRYDDVVATVAAEPALSGAQVVDLNPHTLEDIFADLARVGRAIGREPAATAVVARLRKRVEAVQVRCAGRHRPAPRVACLEWLDPLMMAGNWMPELVEIAGADYALAASGQHTEAINWQQLEEFDPQVVVFMPCGFGLAQTLAEWPALRARYPWQRLQAGQQRRMFAADGNAYFNRSGPRMVDSLELLEQMIWTDLPDALAAAHDSQLRHLQ